MKMLKTAILILIATIGYASIYAQSRNGYKVNGITVAGGHGRGNSAKQLNLDKSNFATGVCVDNDGNVYVADRENTRIQKWAPGATEGVTIVVDPFYHWSDAYDIFCDGKGALYFCDLDGIFKYNLATGERIEYKAAKKQGDDGDFYQGIFVDKNGIVYGVDANKARVKKFAPGASEGTVVAGNNGQGKAANQLSIPSGVFVDDSGNVFVADCFNHRVQKWPPGASEGITVAEISLPSRVFVDHEGNIFVSNEAGNSVEEFTSGARDGVIVAGGNTYSGGRKTNQLNHPTGIWLDAAGNLYVADNGNNRVQKFEKDVPNKVIPQPTPTEVIVHNEPVKPAPEVIKPNNPPPAQIFTSLSWIKPGPADLKEDVYETQSGILPVWVRINSSQPVSVKNIHLMVNGRVLPGEKATVVDLREMKTSKSFGNSSLYQYDYRTTVNLPEGGSTYQVQYNDDKSEQLRVNYQAGGLNLYVLSIGTHNNNLDFPEKDAADVAGLFDNQGGSGRIFHKVRVERLTGPDATARNIAGKISGLARQPFTGNDVLLIFISSHGFLENKQLRITGSDFETIAVDQTSLDFNNDIIGKLNAVNCKKFILLDACYSGAATGKDALSLNISKAIEDLRNAANDFTIITSSSEDEKSWEDKAWQNGAFTRAMEEALRGGLADTNNDHIITIDELYKYISKQVPAMVLKLKNEQQHPRIHNPRGDVPIYVY